MLKPVVFVLGLLPAAYSSFQVWMLQSGGVHYLGADPARELVLIQGQWAIHFLILTLLVTPVRQITGWIQIARLRRMLGLFTFFYASLHLAAYSALLLELDFSSVGIELVERPYITVGFLAWLLLLPLALTSTNRMVRMLGQNWRRLHRIVYAIALLGVAHVFWLAKSSYFDAFIYGSLLVILLVYRLFSRRKGYSGRVTA